MSDRVKASMYRCTVCLFLLIALSLLAWGRMTCLPIDEGVGFHFFRNGTTRFYTE